MRKTVSYVLLGRLEKIAADAGLQSKSSTEFAHMASMLHNRCIQAEADKEIEPEKEGTKQVFNVTFVNL